MSRVIFSLCVFVFCNNFFVFSQSHFNVKSLGARGDGKFDNWQILQRAVDKLASDGGGELYFPNGDYAIYNKTLIIWGNNITIRGESKTGVKIIKKGQVGSFGDCIDVAGKIPGYVYFGNFGKGDYLKPLYYRGNLQPATNILIRDLTITSQMAAQSKLHLANNLGIVNSNRVTIKNCVLKNAPQSNLTIVNDQRMFVNDNINIDGCTFEGSRRHNVRVITMNRGPLIGNKVTISNSIFKGVKGTDDRVKELVGKQVNLWYRGGENKDSFGLVVANCVFDDSGIIYANGNVNGLQVTNSELYDNIFIYHSSSRNKTPKLIFKNNRFYKSNNVNKHINSSLKNKFNKNKNINIFPSSISKSLD